MAIPSLSKKVSLLTGFVDLEDTAPPAPAANRTRLSRQVLAGRQFPAFIGPNGLESMVQESMARKRVSIWEALGNATQVPGAVGFQTLSTVGTVTNRGVTATNALTRSPRQGMVSAATAAATTNLRLGAQQNSLGDGAGLGGFFMTFQFGISDAVLVTNARMFMGMTNATAAPSDVEPSTLINCIGVGHGAADTNLRMYISGSTAQTPIDLGSGFPNALNIPYELALYSPPGTANIVYWQVTRLDTMATTSGSVTGAAAVVPQSSMLLNPIQCVRSNNTTAAAVAFDMMKIYRSMDR